MKLSDFNYHLPEELIANHPTKDRTASRLLYLNANNNELTHNHFRDLPNLLSSNDLIILNNTKVIPARLHGQKATGGQLEILIERITDTHQAWVHIKSNHAPKPGTEIHIQQYKATILAREDRLFFIESTETPLSKILDEHGEIPLPPYFKRQPEAIDESRYQTVYAKHEGAIAAPTAGLHFTDKLLTELKQKNIQIGYLTLHVGAGTFLPVQTEDITEHKMHNEYFTIDETLCKQIEQTKQQGGNIIAVGTTVVRALESTPENQPLKPHQGETNIFIYPGFKFRFIDKLITNFHLPQSSLLMLVSAFAGQQQIKTAYQQAIKEKYRFFSYGDAMLLTKNTLAFPSP